MKQERKGLISLATHYVSEVKSSDGFTLVFAHSTSNRKELSRFNESVNTSKSCFLIDKEQWEIIVSILFQRYPGLLNDAWAVDWQNHGQSAVVNEQQLKSQIVSE